MLPSPALVRPLRITAALSAWGGLMLQYAVVMTAEIPISPTLRTAFFFSYFTVLSNIFAGLALTVPLLSPRTVAARFLDRSSVRAGIACYLIITGVVFVLVARYQIPLQVRNPVSDALLHYVTPALGCAHWFLSAPRRTLGVKHPIIWLWFPTLFAIGVLGAGALTGFYPYPFLDVAALGLPAVAGNIGVLGMGFLGVGFLMVWIDRRSWMSAAAPPSSWRD